MTCIKLATAIENLNTVNNIPILLVNNAFLYHNKEQWEDACSHNSLTKTLMHAQLGTAIEHLMKTLHNFVGK